jgi:hypothetical protein
MQHCMHSDRWRALRGNLAASHHWAECPVTPFLWRLAAARTVLQAIPKNTKPSIFVAPNYGSERRMIGTCLV